MPESAVQPLPNAAIIAIAIVMIGIGAAATLRMPAFWRGQETAHFRNVLDALGEPVTTAAASVVPIAGPATALVGFEAILIVLQLGSTGVIEDLARGGANLLALPVFLIVISGASIFLFGRPKTLVPPRFRDHRGVVGEIIRKHVGR